MEGNEDNKDQLGSSDQARDNSQIVLRVSRRRKSAYVRAANASKTIDGHGKTLAAWCFEHLDQASGFTDNDT